MNAKAKKKAKRKEARSHLQGQAAHEQASKNEAATDDAARKTAVACDGRELWSERSRNPQMPRSLRKQIHGRIAAYLLELVDDIENNEGKQPANEREKLAVRDSISVMCDQTQALIDKLRTEPKGKRFRLTWSLEEEKDTPQGAVHEKVEEGTKDGPPMTDGDTRVAQATTDDAVKTRHHPDPTYSDLWADAVAL